MLKGSPRAVLLGNATALCLHMGESFIYSSGVGETVEGLQSRAGAESKERRAFVFG